MAFDSTPNELAPAGDPEPDPALASGPEGRQSLLRPRTLLIALILGLTLAGGLVATGAADAAGHVIAHALPGVTPDGCGGG